MTTSAASVKQELVTKLAQASGVPPAQVEAVLKSLGLEQLADRVERVTTSNGTLSKLEGLEISVRYDKTMISK